jgi:hypothetical protein
MTLPPAPAKGALYLFDSVTPPLADGSYQVTVETDVSTSGVTPTFQLQRYFDVAGPRFSVPQAMIAACFPPRDGHGAYQDTLPQIVLGRRTLPWERTLVPAGTPLGAANPPPAAVAGDAPPLPDTAVPWVALLLFEEGEYTLFRNLPLEQVLPPAMLQRLGSPAGITCDAVEAQPSLIAAIMPSRQELQLLAHVRWLNVDDRELNIASGDGFFSVVVSNRLPSPGAQHRAVLVSLEGRSDLVQENPPAVATDTSPIDPTGPLASAAPIAGPAAAVAAPVAAPAAAPAAAPGAPPVAAQGSVSLVAPVAASVATPIASPVPASIAVPVAAPIAAPVAGPVPAPVATPVPVGIPVPPIVILRPPPPPPAPVRLVALASWQFTCDGTATFQQLMQGLAHDDAMFGTVDAPGQPPLTDTGHLPMALQDRYGEVEQVLYRGPLVQYPLTRDALGPYHSADQARRVSPETGAEDISYAAAFEAGRLLAAADPRFAQAIMGWRREAYQQSARASTIAKVADLAAAQLPATLAETLHTSIAPIVATAAAAVVVNSAPPIADAYGLTAAAAAPGLNAAALATAWNLASPAQATARLGGDPGARGGGATPPALSARPNTTLAAAAADATGLARLAAARIQAVQGTAGTGGQG